MVVEGRPTLLQRPVAARGDAAARPGRCPRACRCSRSAWARTRQWLPALAGVADGLVVAALGGGHVPDRLAEPLGGVAERMPVVLASRIGAGRVLMDTYRAPGSESDLLGARAASGRAS